MATVKLLLFGALLYTCFLYEAVKSIPTKEFIPYGPRAGDSILIGGNISMDLENGFYMYEYRYDIANVSHSYVKVAKYMLLEYMTLALRSACI